MSDWREGYKAALAEYVKANGSWVDERYYPRAHWNKPDDPTDYDTRDTTYGWWDYRHQQDLSHYGGDPACTGVVSVDMSTLRERTISQFVGTFTDNENEVGVEVRATCACGQYTDKWLRWAGTVGDILPALLEAP